MKKTDLLFLVAIILIIGVWTYMHTSDKKAHYYSYYDNIKGLQISSPVYLKGVKVGVVEDIFVNDNRKIQANFTIKKDLKLPKGTIANITSGDLSGNKAVVLLLGKEKGFIQSGGELVSGVDSSMIENFNAKVTPILHHGKVLLKVADSGLSNFNGFILETFAKESNSSISTLTRNVENITQTSDNIKQQVNGLAPSIQNFNKSVASLNSKNKSITNSIHSGETSTEKLISTNFKDHFESVQSSSQKLTETIKGISNNKIFNNNIGYKTVINSVDTFQQSLNDYQTNPPALINILGKEKKQQH